MLPAIERVGGAPVIIKLIEGTQGIGVLLAETVQAAESIIELLGSQKQNVLIRKFVAENKGKDLRAFVVGDRVVAGRSFPTRERTGNWKPAGPSVPDRPRLVG